MEFDYTLAIQLVITLCAVWAAFIVQEQVYSMLLFGAAGLVASSFFTSEPLFFVLCMIMGVIKNYGVRSGSSRYSFFALIIVLSLLSPASFVEANQGTTGGGSSGNSSGLPSRIAEVERVLFVDEVAKISRQPAINVLGTDYLPGDSGKLMAFLQIGDYPIEFAACRVSVLYPDMSFFINNQLMLPSTQPGFEGLYYYDFVMSNVTGVYPVNAHCYYNITPAYSYPLGVTLLLNGTSDLKQSGLISSLSVVDGVSHTLEGDGDCNNLYCSAYYSFELPFGWHTGTLSDARFVWIGDQDNNDEVKEFYIVAGNQTVFWFNLTVKNVIVNQQFVLNSSFSSQNNFSLLVRSYDWDGGRLRSDYLSVVRQYNGTVVSDLRGNSELVVSTGLYDQYINITTPPEPLTIVTAEQFGVLFSLGVVLFMVMFGYYFVAGGALILGSVFLFSGAGVVIGILLGVVLFVVGFKRRGD